jgi:hypothetical protein
LLAVPVQRASGTIRRKWFSQSFGFVQARRSVDA